MSVAGLRRHIDVAAGHGHIVAGSTMRRIVLDVDRIRPHGDMLVPGDVRAGLRLVHVLDRGRAVAECVACLVRRVYRRPARARVDRVWSLCGAGEGCGMSRPCVLTGCEVPAAFRSRYCPSHRLADVVNGSPFLSARPATNGPDYACGVCGGSLPARRAFGGTCSTSCTMRRAATR